jgi:hypothetical protein
LENEVIIDNNSPFRRIPIQTNRKQILFYDGIRYSVEMADLAHQRLREILYEISQKPTTATTAPEADYFDHAAAVLDAWSIVDLVHRLRDLLYQVPGIKQNSPALQLFTRKTVEIEILRNAVQHLNQQIHQMAAENLPVWGALSWISMPDPEFKSVYSCTLVAGTWFERREPLVSPLGKTLSPPVDLITLEASNCSVCLSDVMRSVEAVVRSLEEILSEQFKDRPYFGRDSLICAEIGFPQESSEEKRDA